MHMAPRVPAQQKQGCTVAMATSGRASHPWAVAPEQARLALPLSALLSPAGQCGTVGLVGPGLERCSGSHRAPSRWWPSAVARDLCLSCSEQPCLKCLTGVVPPASTPRGSSCFLPLLGGGLPCPAKPLQGSTVLGSVLEYLTQVQIYPFLLTSSKTPAAAGAEPPGTRPTHLLPGLGAICHDKCLKGRSHSALGWHCHERTLSVKKGSALGPCGLPGLPDSPQINPGAALRSH